MWSLLTRTLVNVFPVERALRILNAFPRRQEAKSDAILPPERYFRHAGECLGRSIARSQYLRVRGHLNTIVIGVLPSIAGFKAHAWLDSIDPVPPEFVEIRRVER